MLFCTDVSVDSFGSHLLLICCVLVFYFFVAVILSTRNSLKMIKVPSYPERNWEKSLKLKVFSLFIYYSSINLHIFEFLIKYSVLWNKIILFPTSPPPPPSSTLWPSYTSQMLLLPPRRLFFFFSVEFSVSPFQTFFNSGIKGTGGLGRLGYGILQALSENLQIKKALLWFWFGGVVVVGRGWGEERADSGGRWWCCWSGGCFLGFQKKKGSGDYLRRSAAFCFLFTAGERRVSCFCFVDVVVDSSFLVFSTFYFDHFNWNEEFQFTCWSFSISSDSRDESSLVF